MTRILIVLLLLVSPAFADSPVIRIGDIIHLQSPAILGHGMSMSNFYGVDVAGTVGLPGAGKIKIAGMSCEDAAQAIDDTCLTKQVTSRRGAVVSIGGPPLFVLVQGQVKDLDRS